MPHPCAVFLRKRSLKIFNILLDVFRVLNCLTLGYDITGNR